MIAWRNYSPNSSDNRCRRVMATSAGILGWRTLLSAEFVRLKDALCFRFITRRRIKRERARRRVSVPSSELSLADLLTTVIGFIRRQFLVVLSVLPLTIALAAVYLYNTPSSYTAHANILLDTGKVQVFKESVLGERSDQYGVC